MSLLQAEPARRPATMVKTSWEAATACSAGLLTILGAARGAITRQNININWGQPDAGKGF